MVFLLSSLPPATPPPLVRSVESDVAPYNAPTTASLLGSPVTIGHALVQETSSVFKTSSAWNYIATATPLKGILSHQKPTLDGQNSQGKTYLSASIPVTRLITQQRGQTPQEFQIPLTPAPSSDKPTQIPLETVRGIELTADSQQYDAQRQVITAKGNVVMRFQQAVLGADEVEINLTNRLAVATGNVGLRRGQQVLRGDRFEYYFVQDSGVITNASGEYNRTTALQDLSLPLANDVAGNNTIPQYTLSDRLLFNQPVSQVTSSGGTGLILGSDRSVPFQQPFQQGGTINRIRFRAEKVDFEGSNVRASNVRFTNDPFSPAELEVRADRAEFRQIGPQQSEITASRPRLVFDDGFSLPLLRNRISIDSRPREPALFNIGFDGEDRGGVFIERTFEIYNNDNFRFTLTPQYLLQRAIRTGDYLDPDSFGLKAKLIGRLTPRTLLTGSAVFTSLDLGDLDEELRASLRLQQTIGTTLPHTLNLEYSYRDRLFNGSLGYQTVQSSLGAVLTSPVIRLGNSDFYLTYQAGAQFINATSDRPELIDIRKTEDLVNLSRYQASATLSRSFLLWEGQGLPATPEAGLRYSPIPVVPYLRLNTSITGVLTGYSNGDNQNSFSGSIGLQGQFGHFSRQYLDYTGFNVTYSQLFPSGESPFLFDRVVDTKVLEAGITQQISGPFLAGFQTSINLNDGDPISTDYFLEYRRRTYNIRLRYNPVLDIGSISFRINDFNWEGNPEPLANREIRPVVQGVTR
jgi:lipopolysaccharide export system protein LptA